MTWWLASRRAGLVLCGLLVLSLGLLAAQTVVLPAPNLIDGYGAGVQAALAMPTLVASLVLASLSGGDPAAEATSTRRLAIVERGYVLGCVAAPVAIVGIAAAATGELLPATSARNMIGMLGVGLLARPLLGARTAAAIPVVYMLFVAVLGQPAGARHAAAWAWPLAPATDRPAMLLAAVLFVSGLVVGCGQFRSRRWQLDLNLAGRR